MLIHAANCYPLKYLTEKDFFPLVVAYLSGRVPKVQPEAPVNASKNKSKSKVDFRLRLKSDFA
jgi:hypothetical protein